MNGLNWPELLEKARQMAQTASRLQAGLTPGLPERFVTAVEQMAQRANQFVEMVDLPAPPDLRDRVLRHDLRAHLALVIGFSELWQRPGAAQKVESFLPTLADLLGSARKTLDRLDELVASVSGKADPAPPPLSMPTPPSLPFQMSRESGRIMVVDDNRENRDLLQILLEQLGHRVVVAGSGPEALALQAKEEFDLVLLDVMMPEMDGFAVLERIKADDTLRHIPVLMVSALDRLDSVITG
ncbi:MAG: response regulator, partial [Gemmataceae bacterium]